MIVERPVASKDASQNAFQKDGYFAVMVLLIRMRYQMHPNQNNVCTVSCIEL